jgi:hypothetical protein
VFYREHDDVAYSITSFFATYTLLELPFTVCASLVFSLLTTLAAGLPRSASLYAIVATNCFCLVTCGESIGIMFNTLFTHTGFAVSVTSVFLSVSLQLAGILSLHIPPVLQAFNHLSPGKWAVANLAPYSLHGVDFSCRDDQRLPGGNCPIQTGEDALELYGLNGNAGLNLMALGICTVAYRLVAYLLLVGVRTRWWKGAKRI